MKGKTLYVVQLSLYFLQENGNFMKIKQWLVKPAASIPQVKIVNEKTMQKHDHLDLLNLC